MEFQHFLIPWHYLLDKLMLKHCMFFHYQLEINIHILFCCVKKVSILGVATICITFSFMRFSFLEALETDLLNHLGLNKL